MQEQANLTTRQQVQYEEIRRRAVEDRRDVSDLLLTLVDSPRDRAAIADAFTPGTGAGYRR